MPCKQRPVALATSGAGQLADTLAPQAGRTKLATPGPQATRQQVQRILLGKADGAVHRMGDTGADAGCLGGTDLCNSNTEGGQVSVRFDEGSLRSDTSGRRLLGEYRELLLDSLEGADRAAKLVALAGVVRGHVQQRSQGPGDLCGTQQRPPQQKNITRHPRRQGCTGEHRSRAEAQAIAWLSSHVQGQDLFSRRGTVQQDYTWTISGIGNGHHRIDIPPPRHVMHGAIHLVAPQAELNAGAKAEDATMSFEPGLAKQPVGQQRFTQGHWRSKTAGGASQHIEISPPRLAPTQGFRYGSQCETRVLQDAPEFCWPRTTFAAEHVFRRGQIAEQALNGRFK